MNRQLKCTIWVLAILTMAALCLAQAAGAAIVECQVAFDSNVDTDDGSEQNDTTWYGSGKSGDTPSDYVYLGYDGSSYDAAFRFTNVDIP
ncbi:MAG: hypothetical protein KJ957_08585, partial [Candidatus Omnitrophica bacterium]|nr:hypothetical protein [Candidatus Omnitrophota bacterium]